MNKELNDVKKYLQELNKPNSFWQNLGFSPANKEELFLKIGDIGDYRIIPDICRYLLSDDKKIAVAAALAINKLIKNVSQDNLIQLDEVMHTRMVTALYGIWYNLVPRNIDNLIVLPDNTSLLGLASSHQNGYVREAAIYQLTKNHDGRELSYLLLRVNDWVSEVRAAAKKAITARLTTDYAGHFIRNLTLVNRLLNNTRYNHAELVAEIYNLRQKPECRTELYEGFKSLDKKIRRTCYRLALTEKNDNAVQIFNQAISDADPIIRSWAAQKAASLLDKNILREVLEKMLLDPYMAIRRTALQLIVEHLPEIAHQELLTALLNTSISIRELARYYLKKQFPMDFAAFYRDALNKETGKHLLAAICGIGETGIAIDAKRLLPFAKQGLISHRKAAISSIDHLDGDNYTRLFMDALFNEHFGLSKAGREALKNRIYKIDTTKLENVYHSTQYPHIKRNILLLLTRLSRWSRLPYFIMASSDENERVKETGKYYLKKFIYDQQHYIIPTAEQLENIQNAITKYRNGLTDKEYKDILFMLKSAVVR